jgi:hypothetical protein
MPERDGLLRDGAISERANERLPSVLTNGPDGSGRTFFHDAKMAELALEPEEGNPRPRGRMVIAPD